MKKLLKIFLIFCIIASIAIWFLYLLKSNSITYFYNQKAQKIADKFNYITSDYENQDEMVLGYSYYTTEGTYHVIGCVAYVDKFRNLYIAYGEPRSWYNVTSNFEFESDFAVKKKLSKEEYLKILNLFEVSYPELENISYKMEQKNIQLTNDSDMRFFYKNKCFRINDFMLSNTYYKDGLLVTESDSYKDKSLDLNLIGTNELVAYILEFKNKYYVEDLKGFDENIIFNIR